MFNIQIKVQGQKSYWVWLHATLLKINNQNNELGTENLGQTDMNSQSFCFSLPPPLSLPTPTLPLSPFLPFLICCDAHKLRQLGSPVVDSDKPLHLHISPSVLILRCLECKIFLGALKKQWRVLLKKKCFLLVTRESVWWLKASIALLEDPSSIPSL